MNSKLCNCNESLMGLPQSYWLTSTIKDVYPRIDRDIKTDVAIIGGGIVGITCAYLLKKEGFNVTIVESASIAQGTSAHTTAKITSQHNLIYDKIKKSHSEEKAKQYADANESAIKIMEEIIRDNAIDCDFVRCPSYVYTKSEHFIQSIFNEVGTAAKLGIKASYVDKLPLPFSILGAVRFDNQAQFHPRKYLLSLAKQIPDDNNYIFEKTQVVNIASGSPCTIITSNGYNIFATNVVIASHYPCFDGFGLYFTRLYAEKSYILAAKIKEKFPKGMFINAEQPTRSLRAQKFDDEEIVLIAGEHHKTGQDENTIIHYENLKNFMHDTFKVDSILYRWCTQDFHSLDGLPYVGTLSSSSTNIYVATGFGKWGITNGTASAVILKDLIVKGESTWKDVYNPSRFTPTASVKNFFVQNTDVMKNFISGNLSPALTNAAIKIGEAKVIEMNGKKVGAYRDHNGKLHLVDTTCTHLKCQVTWNNAEKTWDCPCHGSRFAYNGEVIDGPSLKPLKIIDHYTSC